MVQNDVIVKLREIFLDRFNEQELRDLCFDLRVDYDSLSGSGRSDKVRELIAYCVRRNMIGDLLSVVAVRRKDVYLVVKDSGILSAGDVRTNDNVEYQRYGSIFENTIGNINKLRNSIIIGDNLLIMSLILFVVIFALSMFVSSLVLFLMAMMSFLLLAIMVLLRYNFSLFMRIVVIIIVIGSIYSLSSLFERNNRIGVEFIPTPVLFSTTSPVALEKPCGVLAVTPQHSKRDYVPDDLTYNGRNVSDVRKLANDAFNDKNYIYAIENAGIVITYAPHDVKAHFIRGRSYLELYTVISDSVYLSHAISDLSVVVTLDEMNFGGHYNLSLAYDYILDLQNPRSDLLYRCAVGHSERAIEIDNNATAAIKNLGQLHLDMEKPCEALKQFDIAITQVISRNTTYDAVHFYRGQAYRMLGNKEEARRAFELVKNSSEQSREVNILKGKIDKELIKLEQILEGVPPRRCQ